VQVKLGYDFVSRNSVTLTNTQGLCVCVRACVHTHVHTLLSLAFFREEVLKYVKCNFLCRLQKCHRLQLHDSSDQWQNVAQIFDKTMAYYNSDKCSLNMLWDSVNCERQSSVPVIMDKHAFRGAPVIDIYTAASIGDYDVIHDALNR